LATSHMGCPDTSHRETPVEAFQVSGSRRLTRANSPKARNTSS
jgi:hypothetical protein